MTAVLCALALAAAPGAEPPDVEGPSILHTPVRAGQAGRELTIEAEIADRSGIFQPLLYWRAAGAPEFAQIALELKAGETYAAAIPGFKVTGDLEYFLEAYDSIGNGPNRVGSSERPIRVRVSGGKSAAAAAPEAPPAPAAAVTAPGVEGSSATGPLITLGAGAAALAAGAFLYLGAASALDQLDARYSPGAGRSKADADATRAAITRGQIGSGAIIAGGLAAIAGAAWWLWPAPAPGAGAMLGASLAY